MPRPDAAELLDGVCPYFTRFPLSFPLDILKGLSAPAQVLDPCCGCGTTLLAARLTGNAVLGVDVHPVAAAIAHAKLVRTTPKEVMNRATMILKKTPSPDEIPSGVFWKFCFHPEVLNALCLFRARYARGFLDSAEHALYAILLGILHGSGPEVLSNDMPASFSPSPVSLCNYWNSTGASPPIRDPLSLISLRAERLPNVWDSPVAGAVRLGDFRCMDLSSLSGKFDLVITSPPYYGLDSYSRDQWLRSWLLGGSSTVEETPGAIRHITPSAYIQDLGELWRTVAACCKPGAEMWLRFGNVPGMEEGPPLVLLDKAFEKSEARWTILESFPVLHEISVAPVKWPFFAPSSRPLNEVCVHARLMP